MGVRVIYFEAALKALNFEILVSSISACLSLMPQAARKLQSWRSLIVFSEMIYSTDRI